MSYQAKHYRDGCQVVDLVTRLSTEQAYECMLEYASRSYPIFCDERREFYEDGKWFRPEADNDRWAYWRLEVPTQEDFTNILERTGQYTLTFEKDDYMKISRL